MTARPVLETTTALLLACGLASPAAALQFTEHVLPAAPDGPVWVEAADVDGDGDDDVLWLSPGDDLVAWQENLDGAGSFGAPRVVCSTLNAPGSATVADMDADGDLDVAYLSGFPVRIEWAENTDGAGTFGARHVVHSPAFTLSTDMEIQAGDLDDDGAVDLLVTNLTGSNTLCWFRYVEELGTWRIEEVIVDQLDEDQRGAALGDIDGDGSLDVAHVQENQFFERVVVSLNDGAGVFTSYQVTTDIQGAEDVDLADVDLDGRPDLVVGSDGAGPATGFYSSIQWMRNLGLSGSFPQFDVPFVVLLEDDDERVVAVHCVDVDKDGDPDVVAGLLGTSQLGSVAWVENTSGGAWIPHSLSSTPQRADAVASGDLDGDCVPDPLAAWSFLDEVRWYENPGDGLWTNLGGSTVGAAGHPCLTGSGDLLVGTDVHLRLDDAPPGALVLLWLAYDSTPFAALGGTVYPNPPVRQFLRVADGAGSFGQSLVWPTTPAGIDVYLQFIVQDASVIHGLTLSDGIVATTL